MGVGSRRRRGVDVGAAVLVGVGVLLAPLPYVDALGPVPALQAFLPYVGALGLLVTLTCLLRRRLITAAVALVASAMLLTPALPLTPRPAVPPDAGRDIVVLALNVEFGGADADAVIDAARTTQADVLVLLEASPDFWARLSTAGLPAMMPHATGTIRDDAGGTIVATREPVTCPFAHPVIRCGEVVPTDRRGATGEPYDQVDVRLVDGTLLRGAHPHPPSTPPRWRADMTRLGSWVADHDDEPRLVVAGDLNSGPMHPAFRAATGDLVPAPRRWPWHVTWPRDSRIPPFVQIDHVLSRGFAVADEGTLVVPGTDHAGVWARLR